MVDWEKTESQNIPELRTGEVSSNFTITGNSTLTDAKLILLNDKNHQDMGVGLSIVGFLRQEIRKGDMLLLEGYPSGEKVDTSNNPLLRKLDSDVAVIGWDDMGLFKKQDGLHNQVEQIDRELSDNKIPNQDRMILGVKKKRLHDEIRTTIKGRNKGLQDTLESMKTSPSKKIKRHFVVLGENHLDEDLMQYSKKHPHVILTPKF